MAKEIKALRKEIESRRADFTNTSVVTANKILSEENVKLRNFIEQAKAINQQLSDELNDARIANPQGCPAIREDIQKYIENQIAALTETNLSPHGDGRLTALKKILELAGGTK